MITLPSLIDCPCRQPIYVIRGVHVAKNTIMKGTANRKKRRVPTSGMIDTYSSSCMIRSTHPSSALSDCQTVSSSNQDHPLSNCYSKLNRLRSTDVISAVLHVHCRMQSAYRAAQGYKRGGCLQTRALVATSEAANFYLITN